MNHNTSTLQNNIQTSIAAAELRAKSDPTRPMYHFRPPAQWMNDPNGTIYHEGYYHTFYQFNPYNDEWASIHWGHARSRDLVHWEHLPIALFPGDDRQEAHCASGCLTMNANGVPMIFYTNFSKYLEGAPYDQRAAIGSPDLIGWKKHPANPILDINSPGNLGSKQTWRDPFIFRAGKRIFMILGEEIAENWIIPIYEAANPEYSEWTYRGILYELPKSVRTSHFLFECPNFFAMNGKWVLLFSPMTTAVEYMVGTFDERALTFRPEKQGIFDQGFHPDISGLYATNIFHDPQGRIVLVGWIRGFQSGRGWNGCLSLPRVLSLDEQDRLCQEPIPELRQLRGEHLTLSQFEVSNASQRLKEGSGAQLEILAQFLPGTAKKFGVHVRCADDGSAAVPVSYDGQYLEVADVRFPFSLEDDDELLTLHIFLDRSVMEVFVNGGRICATRVLYPPEKNLGVEVFSQEGLTTVKQLDIWAMHSSWEA